MQDNGSGSSSAFGADRLDLEGLESWLLEQIGIHAECGIAKYDDTGPDAGELAGLKHVAILSALGRTVKRVFRICPWG